MAGTGSRKGISYKILPSRRDWVLNAQPVLLLHCDGADEGTTFKDSGITGHTMTAVNDAQIDTAQSWRGQSALFDGTGDAITAADHANWDISTNWTADLRVRFNGVPDNNMVFIEQAEDSTNFWSLYYNFTQDYVIFTVRDAGGLLVTLAGGSILANVWTHVALCKVGNEYGTYIDGIQKAHVSDADTDTYTAKLSIGIHNVDVEPVWHFKGWLDEIRIVPSNPFGAAPVEGLTDTIKVPFKPYISWS